MAILGINMRPTPQPREKQKDRTFTEKALDNVLKAAKIAQVGFGIYTDFEKLDLKDKEIEVQGETNLQKIESDLAKRWNDDSRAKEIVTEYNAATKIDDVLADDTLDPQKYSTAVMGAVRAAVGPGPLSDQEIQMFSPDPSIWAQVKRAYNRAKSGKALREDAEALKDVAEIIRRRSIRDIENHAFWFAKSQGRRHGNPDFLVNNILLPRTRLTGAARVGNLTIRKDTGGLEGQVQAGETRVRTRKPNLPTEQSRQVEQIVQQYNEQKLDPSITAEKIDALMRKFTDPKTGKTISRGQAIWMLNERLKTIKKTTQGAAPNLAPEQQQTKGMMDTMQQTIGN
jgi:hypothetical protein